jgi:3-oxoacyl-[acyl-carrier protein] reductase
LVHKHARVALVSSGSRGIGAANVRRLAADGWDISFCHRGDERAAVEVEKAAGELGARVVAVEADVRFPAEVTAWFERAEDELGPVEALVSCAGIARDRPLTLVPEAEWRTVIETGLEGVFHLCQTAAFAMMKRRHGRIVAVSSVCGEYDHAPAADRTHTRPGVEGFIRSLASQAARFSVSVNAITPEPVIRSRDIAALVPERHRDDLAETIALRRFGSAADVAELVGFLLSPEAADMTGRVLEVPTAILGLPRDDHLNPPGGLLQPGRQPVSVGLLRLVHHHKAERPSACPGLRHEHVHPQLEPFRRAQPPQHPVQPFTLQHPVQPLTRQPLGRDLPGGSPQPPARLPERLGPVAGPPGLGRRLNPGRQRDPGRPPGVLPSSQPVRGPRGQGRHRVGQRRVPALHLHRTRGTVSARDQVHPVPGG